MRALILAALATFTNALTPPKPLDALRALTQAAGDDVRGVADAAAELSGRVALAPESVYWIGAGFRSWLGSDKPVAVGRAPRLTSEAIAESFVEGSRGVDAGAATTPAMLETLLGDGDACGSVMVTASHLPPEYNGLKFFSKALGRGLNKREVKEVMAAAEAAAAAGARPDEAPTAEDAWRAAAGFSGRKEAYRFMDPYVDKLRRTIIDVAGGGDAKPLAGFKICVNAGNGAGGFFAA